MMKNMPDETLKETAAGNEIKKNMDAVDEKTTDMDIMEKKTTEIDIMEKKITDMNIMEKKSTGMDAMEEVLQADAAGNAAESSTELNAEKKSGKIDTVRKVLAAVGCGLMLLSILFPFLRMTYPNGEVADMSRKETFAVGMEGWDAGPYIIWALILLACGLILYFQWKDQRKRTRHGCRIAFLILIFDALTIAGFIAQYGSYEISFLPLAGFWLLLAGWLISWIASFLHKRKKKPKKSRKRRSKKGRSEYFEEMDDPEGSEAEEGDNAAEATPGSGKSGRKLYREAKKQQKLEREERMRKAAERKSQE